MTHRSSQFPSEGAPLLVGERDLEGRSEQRRFNGAFRGGSHGLRAAKMLASADLQLIILLLLSDKPRHGYELIKALEQHSCGIYTPSPGMVYPALTYLEELGLAAASSEGSKKLYTLTQAGATHLGRNRQAADEAWGQLALVGRKLAHIQRQIAQDEDVAEHFGSDPQGRDRAEWQAMKAEFRALRDDLKAAIHEKLDSSLQEKRRILEVMRAAIRDIRGRP